MQLFYFLPSVRGVKQESFKGVAIFSSSVYILIVYVTKVNIKYSLSTCSRFQSENERKKGRANWRSIACRAAHKA